MPAYKYSVSFVEPSQESEAFFSGVVAPYTAGQISQLVTNEAFFAVQNASDWLVWLDSWETVSTPWEDLR